LMAAGWPYVARAPNEPPGGYDFRQQPLLRWYAFSGQTGPQSYGRVPDALASSSQKRAWEELARPWGIVHHLSIPLDIRGGDHNAFLIHRPDRDFTDQELALARLLQPILTGIALHFGIAQSNSAANLDGSAHDLTSREMTILTLLSQGLTAEGLARRLSISPRTVGKHLEHIYRKLDVCDRLMAVQTAHELGLLTPTHLSISTIIPNRIFPQPSASAGIANFPCCCGMPRQTGLASSTPLLRQMFISCVRPEKWSLIGAPLLKKTVLPGKAEPTPAADPRRGKPQKQRQPAAEPVVRTHYQRPTVPEELQTDRRKTWAELHSPEGVAEARRKFLGTRGPQTRTRKP